MGGSFSVTTSNGYISGNINWSESNVNTANNTSDVYAEMRLSRTNSGYTSYGTDTFYITINGTQISNTLSYTITQNSNTLMVSGTVTVPHNSDGTKTITISWSGGGGSGGVFTVNSGSGSATLTTIARASTVSSFPEWTAGTQNLPISLSVNDASYHHTLDMYVLEISGSTWDHVGTRTNIGSSTTWVFTDAEIQQIYTTNSQYEYRGARLYVTTYDSGGNVVGTSDDTTGKVDAVPTGTTTLGTNGSFNIGTSIPYSINNFVTALSGTGTFYYDITLAGGGFSKTWSNITAKSGTLTLTTAEMNSLYAATPNSNTLSMTCTTRTKYDTIYTEDGNPTSHDTTATANVTNSNPTFGTGYTYQDTNSTTTGVTGNNQYIVQNKSTVEVDLPSGAVATAQNSANIISYRASLGSSTVSRYAPYSAPTMGVSANAGSTLATGTYYVKYTWVDSNGESLASPEGSYTVSATGNNLVITVPTMPSGVTTTKVYVSTTAGGEKLQGTTTSTTYTLSAPPSTGGVATPTAMPFSMGTLNASSNATLTMTAVDSRGNQTATTSTITVVPYTPPVVTTTSTRGSGFTSTVTIALSGSYSLINVGGTTKNSLATVQYTYKKTTDGSYPAGTNFTYTTSSGTYSATSATATMDNTLAWNVQVTVTDKLSTTTVVTTVSSGVPIAFMDATKKSVGVGQFPQNNGTLELTGDFWVNSNPFVSTQTATIPATAGWYRVAQTASSIVNNLAEFELLAAESSHHSYTKLIAGIDYGSPNLTLIQTAHNCYGTASTAAITQARIVYNSTYSGNYAYLEVYWTNASSYPLTVRMIGGSGWSLIAPNTAGSIPSSPTGYTSTNITLFSGGITSANGLAVQSGTDGGVQFLNSSGIKFDAYGNIKPRDTSTYSSTGSWGVVNANGVTQLFVPMGSSGGQVQINNGRNAVSSANGEWRLEIVTMNISSPGTATNISGSVTFGTAFTTTPNVLYAMITSTVSYVDVMCEPFIYSQSTTGFSCKFTTYNATADFGSGTLVANFLVFGK